MPIYSHECETCKKIFDLWMPMDRRDEVVNCPDCGEVLQRLISAPLLIKIN